MSKLRRKVDLWIVDKIQKRYQKQLSRHMKLTKEERNELWFTKKTVLFHITGAAAMLRDALLTYTMTRKGYGL